MNDPAPLSAARLEIVIEDTGEVLRCAPHQNLLKAMEQLGRKGIPVGCRGGGCGVCKVRVIEGRYRTGKMSHSHVSPEQRREGYALACKLYPDTALRIKVVGKLNKPLMRGAAQDDLPACWRAPRPGLP